MQTLLHDVKTTLTSSNQPWFNVETTMIAFDSTFAKHVDTTSIQYNTFGKLTLQNQLSFNAETTITDRRGSETNVLKPRWCDVDITLC